MSEQKLDILNREEFINRVIQLVKLISSNKENMTFAINGSWGCGKTFVLEEIERRLSEDESKKYLVIHYNCWQYDYYDEPLIAIVSALITFLKKTRKVSPNRKDKIISAAKDIGKTFVSLGGQFLEYKTGIKGSQIAELTNAVTGAVSDANAQEMAFDAYINLKGALDNLKKELSKLAEKKTIVFCVDELDRCLPEYAIKVLERLHHLTEDMPNIVTVFAVDKERLEHTVASIFGNGNATDYLKKFVRFELSLDNGQKNVVKLFEKFPDFYARFDPVLYAGLNKSKVNRFLDELLGTLDPRTLEQIIEKATIINDICFGSEQQDYTMMYMELFIATLYYGFHDESVFSQIKVLNDLSNIFSQFDTIPPAFKMKSSGFNFEKATLSYGIYGNGIQIDPTNIFMLMYLYWRNAVPSQNYSPNKNEMRLVLEKPNNRLNDNIEKVRQFIEVLKTIA